MFSYSYEKSLRLSNDERAGRTTGDIVNYMSTDAKRIADITQYGTILWSGIFQMTLAFVSLYQLLGWQVSCSRSHPPYEVVLK